MKFFVVFVICAMLEGIHAGNAIEDEFTQFLSGFGEAAFAIPSKEVGKRLVFFLGRYQHLT